MSAHCIMMGFEGIPAIYFNSIFGNSNDYSKFIISGNKRDLNRYRWNKDKLENHLRDETSKQSKYYKGITEILSIRRKQKAFHPNAARKTLNLGPSFFGIKRTSINGKQSVYCITNITSSSKSIVLKKAVANSKNLLKQNVTIKNSILFFKPFQTVWLSKKN